MREEHLWTQDPGDNGEIEWGFRGLQEGCAFKTDYKCKIASQDDTSSFVG